MRTEYTSGEMTKSPSKSTGGWMALALGLLVRAVINPRVALDLLSLVWAFRAREWFRHPPFLPIPPRDYMQWRMYTAYGDSATVPPVQDVLRFARWRRTILSL